MRGCGSLTWAGGASGCSVEACIEKEEAEDSGYLGVVQLALIFEKAREDHGSCGCAYQTQK